MSGNPFRRAQQQPPTASRLDSSLQRPRTPPHNLSKARKKRVVIQTPPHSPEEPAHEPPRRLSDGRTGSPPPPVTHAELDDDDDTDSTATADDELEAAGANARRNSGPLQPPPTSFHTQSGSRAPYNPFARTLATSEGALGAQTFNRVGYNDEAGGQEENVVVRGTGRPALDVDVFKNILMTGTATPPLSRPPDSGDHPITSRNPALDSLHLPESPRHSFDDFYSHDSEDEDNEQSSLMGPVETRPQEIAPPAPPKPGQYPQTVSFANFESSMSSSFLRPTVMRNTSDLNKPLPAPPPVSAPSISEDLKGLSVDPLKDDNLQKKAPPPPPVTRRQGQSSASQSRARSSSNLTQDSMTEDKQETPSSSNAYQNKTPAPPPPPPSRRTQPQPPSSLPGQDAPSSASLQTDGAPATMRSLPLRQNPIKASGSLGRTSSTSSRSSIPRPESAHVPSTMPGTGANAPPVPPPRRGPGSSKIVSAGTDPSSTHSTPQSLDDDAVALALAAEEDTTVRQPKRDFMSDLAAFQAEIDALRAQAAKTPPGS